MIIAGNAPGNFRTGQRETCNSAKNARSKLLLQGRFWGIATESKEVQMEK
jgi:hypothetical protein